MPDGPFTLRFDVQDADGEVAYGAFTVDTCEATEPVTPTTNAPTTTPAPTTTDAPAPATSDSVAGGSVVPPSDAAATTTILADGPAPALAAAARPAALATTGTPMTAMAFLGGGLVLAGAGALVATRRRA